MVTTPHQYLKSNPVKFTDTSLILGTIHPHPTKSFKIDFFYGNRGSFWDMLSAAFPKYKFNSVNSIKLTLRQRKVWISDMILKCSRDSEKVTADERLKNIVSNFEQIKTGIIKSKIHTIFFTSSFGKNNAAKLFCKDFVIKPIPKLNESREFEIDKKYFGRKITGIVLFSPSGIASKGISRSKLYLRKKEKYKSSKLPVKDFRIDFYRNAFKDIF